MLPGYRGTMGADYIDYIVADDVLIPKENKYHSNISFLNLRMYFHEKIINMPHSGLVNDLKQSSRLFNSIDIIMILELSYLRILNRLIDNNITFLKINLFSVTLRNIATLTKKYLKVGFESCFEFQIASCGFVNIQMWLQKIY